MVFLPYAIRFGLKPSISIRVINYQPVIINHLFLPSLSIITQLVTIALMVNDGFKKWWKMVKIISYGYPING